MIDLEMLKSALRIDHAEDDNLLSIYLAGAKEECRQWIDREDETLPESPLVDLACVLFVRMSYDAAVDDMEAYRTAARRTIAPLRERLGA